MVWMIFSRALLLFSPLEHTVKENNVKHVQAISDVGHALNISMISLFQLAVVELGLGVLKWML